MNICMMTNTYLPHVGGVARSVQTFTEDYRRMGHRVLVVAPEFSGDDGKDSEELPDVVRLPAIQQFNGSDFSVRLPLTAIFNQAIDDFEAHVVHSHHPFLLGDSALRIAARKHAPIIFTHHTLYEEYTHYVPFDSPAVKQFAAELSTEFANLCDGVIAPSQSIADLIKSRGVETRIEVIPTGVDVEAFANGDGARFRKANGLSRDTFVVGHVGRLAPEKNLTYLAEAVADFIDADGKAIFLVVGSGPSAEEIEKVFERRGLTKCLLMAGKKTGQDLYDAYKAMNVFAFSSFSETQGMVLAEAMAAGLPVVALDASGVREVMKNERNGFMLPEDAPEKLFAEKLLLLEKDAELRKKMRAAARRTANHFSRTVTAEKALEYYDQVRRATRTSRIEAKANAWVSISKRLEVEFGLIREKATAAIHALLADEPVKGISVPQD